jgi:hypothetical protein
VSTDEVNREAGGVAEKVAGICEGAVEPGLGRESNAEEAKVLAASALGEVGDVEDFDQGKRSGFAGRVAGDDGDIADAVHGAVDAGDKAEVVAKVAVDKVGRNG